MSGLVDKITKAVMGISAIVVFVITFLQVLCRFVLKSPLPWSTDILRLAFTYLVFWGAAWCVREKEHLNVDVLLMSFPVKIRKVVELGIDLVLSLFFVFMIVFGIKFCAFGWTQTTSYLPIPMSVYYASIPSAGLAVSMLALSLLFDRLTGKESLGGGDVKLFFVTGLYMRSAWEVLFFLILSCVLGIAGSVIGRREKIPFGPAIAAACFCMLLYGDIWTQWYTGLF